MHHRYIAFFIFLVTLTIFPLLVATESHAVPAFTRAHKVECTTCHTIYPELNEYGEAFLKNSYSYFGKPKKGEKKEAAPAPKSDAAAAPAKIQGDGDADKLNKLKGGALGSNPQEPAQQAATPDGEQKAEGIMLAAIPEIIPISFTGSINYAYDRNRVNEVDFAARSVKLHAAGNFRDLVGFYGTYVAYSEQPPAGIYNTSSTASNNKTDINEFFLSFRNLFGSPINIKIGRMQPKLGLWKTNNKLSVTNNYLPYTYTVGNESQFRVEQAQDAVEMNSILGKRFFIAGGVVNRKGQTAKEGYAHASFKIGGADFLANEPEVDLSKDESILDFLTLTFGGYGYFGRNGVYNQSSQKNDYMRYGLDTELLYKVFRLRMLGGLGEDNNVAPSTTTATNAKTLVRSRSATIEAEYTILLNLIAAGRFEYMEQEQGPTVAVGATPAFGKNYMRRYVGTLAYAPLENLKLSLEYKYEILQSEIVRMGVLGATFSF